MDKKTREQFREVERGTDDCLADWPPHLLRQIEPIVKSAENVAELVAAVDEKLRNILGLPEGSYPKQTDAVVRYWKFCRHGAAATV